MTPSGAPDSTGPPDRQTLRLLERHPADSPIVAGTAFEPNPHEPRRLRADLDTGQYPDSVDRVTLDIRWFTSGDFTVHYVEHGPDSRWECRWDRHPNDHSARLHFHRPPDGTETESLSLPSVHPLEVYSVVLAAVEKRLDTHWD
jgi:hypothetical protein